MIKGHSISLELGDVLLHSQPNLYFCLLVDEHMLRVGDSTSEMLDFLFSGPPYSVSLVQMDKN